MLVKGAPEGYVSKQQNMWSKWFDDTTNDDDIKNNAWVIVNNDFWVTSEAICQ